MSELSPVVIILTYSMLFLTTENRSIKYCMALISMLFSHEEKVILSCVVKGETGVTCVLMVIKKHDHAIKRSLVNL